MRKIRAIVHKTYTYEHEFVVELPDDECDEDVVLEAAYAYDWHRESAVESGHEIVDIWEEDE